MKIAPPVGMGLAIARGIIEAHGDRIWAHNPPGHGALFTFTVPVESKTAAELLPLEGA